MIVFHATSFISLSTSTVDDIHKLLANFLYIFFHASPSNASSMTTQDSSAMQDTVISLRNSLPRAGICIAYLFSPGRCPGLFYVGLSARSIAKHSWRSLREASAPKNKLIGWSNEVANCLFILCVLCASAR